MDKVPMTQNGYDKLVAELKDLKSNQRPAVIAAIAEAREHGDLSENAEYHAAREQQSFIEGRIQELEGVIGAADVLAQRFKAVETVSMGGTWTSAKHFELTAGEKSCVGCEARVAVPDTAEANPWKLKGDAWRP